MTRTFLLFLATATLGAAGNPTLAPVLAAPLDIVIKGGRIVDGTGAPWYVADVAIDDGKIVRIGEIEPGEGELVIDAAGLVVAPGFIDMMGQTASPMIDKPATALNLLTQGITTINTGEGASAAPLSAVEGQRQGWTTMAEYFALLEIKGLPVNVTQTVGHTQVRRIVLGDTERRPSDEELAKMQALVREAMEAGAIGVSTALIYPPAVYARTKEIAALAAVAGEYGGRYYTHMRNEGDQLLEAIDEAMDIGRIGKTPVHIFHLKAAGQQNWGKMPLALAKIKAARASGQEVTADIYPYVNNGLGIAALIHPRHFRDGREALRARLDDDALRAEIRQEIETTSGWENWYRHAGSDWNRIVIGRSNAARYSPHDGTSVAVMAAALNEDPWETFFNLVRADAFALPETMTVANKIQAMQENFVSFCTDVGPAGGSRIASHPRAFGSFPRLLSRYVRQFGAISLERAVAQASATAANDVFAFDRGRIAVGLAADIILFDFDKLADEADFANPQALSTGMKHVIVNGQPVLRDGQFTGARPGRVLRGPGWKGQKAPHAVSTGDTAAGLADFDRILQTFLRQHRVPGLSVAVTDRGRVAVARGYGYADLASGRPVQPSSQFRIASLSKPITAVAVLKLVEEGKLKLDDRVFSLLDLPGDDAPGGPAVDDRLRKVTIRHLLQHRGGWDRAKSFDAMFQAVRFANQMGVPAPAKPATVIEAMLTQRLDFDPGERYAYSNFGYCLLGRVIERVSGQSYQDYVAAAVLKPLGMASTQLGATRLAERATNEVRYYHPGRGSSVFQDDLGQPVPWPYGGWYLEAMDAHGGWISTATDLARFAAAFDDPDNCPVLTRASIEAMHACPPADTGDGDDIDNAYYSLGWMNRDVGQGRRNHWHTGSLAGTSAIMIRRHDGKNFVALLNARVSPGADHLGRAIDPVLHEAVNTITRWPTE